MTDTTENSGTTENTETPENEAPEAAAPEIDLAEALLAKDQEIADLKDRVLRSLADLENTRRRLERDKAEATQYAVTGFARDMLAVAENLRRAVASLPAEGFDNVRAGIEATERELLAIFGRQGISQPPSGDAGGGKRHGRRQRGGRTGQRLDDPRSPAAPGDGECRARLTTTSNP